MLADAEMQVATSIITRRDIASSVERQARLGGRREVGGAAKEPGDPRGHGIQHLARRATRPATPFTLGSNTGRS